MGKKKWNYRKQQQSGGINLTMAAEMHGMSLEEYIRNLEELEVKGLIELRRANGLITGIRPTPRFYTLEGFLP